VICGENAKMFFEKIGFSSRVKKRATKKIPKNSNTNIDIIPNLRRLLKEIRKGLSLTQFDCGIPRTTYQHYERGDRNPSYKKLKKVVFEFKKAFNISKVREIEKKLILLEKISESDVFWDKIVSIKKVKKVDDWVYDLQVKNVHNFVANSLIVHNSRILQQSADIAPKSIYVSGKTTSGVGLCVSGDSLITLNDAGVQKIGDFVDENFKNGVEEIPGAFSTRFDSKVLSLGDDSKISYQLSPKIWKIKPPEKMIKISTQRGKQIKITPNTQIIRMENGKPTWVKTSDVSINDLIATTKENNQYYNSTNSDIYWDKIAEKQEYEPKEEWVYDLTVEDNHNFIANGIIVHNTVAAERDELGDGGWTLKAGALVLASGGMTMIDEFDKIDEEDRAALHEAMESGQISIAKAGMVAKFRTKTSILAAANPKWGRFDQNKNLADQFNIAPTLLSRFDLIFPIVDVLDEEKDSKLAHHILQTHMGHDVGEEYERLVDKGILRKYIAYARRHVKPKLSKSASDKIKEFYVELRSKGKDTGSVTITPRYLEGLVRLAEANAKMRLSKTVDERDSDTAIKLLNHVMRQVMTDKETGSLDVDVVATGKPKSRREKLQKEDTIMEIIRDILKSEDSAEIERIISIAIENGIDERTANRIIVELKDKRNLIYENELGYVKIVGE
jgi:replicative DNA helicase Mcm